MTKLIDGKEGKVTSVINELGNLISRFVSLVENIRGYGIEMCAMIIYSVVHFLVSFYHEPWFDEAEAWQIARCASIHDIIFEIPHLEGHSPMWDFILMPWARLGAPYEVSLSIVSFLFMGTAVALIIWKAPWPRLVRITLPFTYFFLYQYGVICRPYCVITLLLVMTAYLYPTKDDKPGRFVLCLAFLAYIHAYGLLIAGGISLVWLIEIWNRSNKDYFIYELIRDKRAWMLFGLLIVAILTIIQIAPREDTFATSLTYERNNVFIRILYTFLALPVDTTMTNIWSDYYGLEGTRFAWNELCFACLLGVLLWCGCIAYGMKKKTCALLLIPYGFFSIGAAIKYMSMHHIGVGLMLLICWNWISTEKKIDNEKELFIEEKKIIVSAAKCLLVFAIGISLSWSVFSISTDINYIYSFGREEAKYIEDNQLYKYSILAEWEVTKRENSDEIALSDFNANCIACNTLPYLDHNIYFNFNNGDDEKAYVIHKINSNDDNSEYIRNIKNKIPEVLLGEPEINMIYDENDLGLEDYVLIYHNYALRPWKTGRGIANHKIYMLKEVANENGFKAVR